MYSAFIAPDIYIHMTYLSALDFFGEQNSSSGGEGTGERGGDTSQPMCMQSALEG